LSITIVYPFYFQLLTSLYALALRRRPVAGPTLPERGIGRSRKVDLKLAKMSLEKLLEPTREGFPNTNSRRRPATRHSILGISKNTWRHGLAVPVPEISAGQSGMGWTGGLGE
jgi:hypothetical protein